MKLSWACVALTAAVGLAVGPVQAADIPITVTNREAVARSGEPVTGGVPFAAGTLLDPSGLRVLANGNEVPAQVLVTSRWPDGSVRWVLVDFQVDLPASGTRDLTVQTGTAPAPVSGITVTDTPTVLTVQTQTATFAFTKSELSIAGHRFTVQAGGSTYEAVPGPLAGAWAIEEQGPMKTVVRVDGVWRSAGAPLVNDLNGFRARIVFFRGKNTMRVFLTFRNTNSFGWDVAGGGQPQQPDVILGGASLGSAPLLPAGGSYHFGSGVERTWEAEVTSGGLPTLRRTRFAADGTLAAGDNPPRPLLAARPSYYASTRAWGRVAVPVTGAEPALQADFDRFERLQRAKVDRALVDDPPGTTGTTVWDHMGADLEDWIDYGDLRWDGNGCGTLSGNHYDWIYGMYLQFMRTGIAAFADAAGVFARHEIDADIYHTGADSRAFNYQKNWEDRPSHANPGNCFGGGRPSHTWSQGYALQWLLMGDPRGRDAFNEIQEGVRQYVYESFNGEGYIDDSEIRIHGWLVENLVNRWRVEPDATLATADYGPKSIPAAIRDVLRAVLDREAAAGQQGFVISDADPGGYLRQTLVHAYFLEPAIKAYEEVLAAADAGEAARLLGLIERMTRWLMSVTYGGDTNGSGHYRPRQIPSWVDTRVSGPSDGQIPYLLMTANAAAFLYERTSDVAWRDYARAAFQDYVRYMGAIGPDSYGDPTLRTPASYRSSIFTGTESKVHGWSTRYGQYVLAIDGGTTPTSTLQASPTALQFGAVRIEPAGTLASVTPAQTVTVSQSGGTGVAWTASADVSWLTIAAADANGTGTGTFTVTLNNTGNVLPATGTVNGTITITAPGATGNPTVAVQATLYAPGSTLPPFGLTSSPAPNAVVQGAVGITGWVLDDIGMDYVRLYRNCLPFEDQLACQTVAGQSVVWMGDATLVAGARSDIEGTYPTYPQNNRAGFGYAMLSNLSPHIPNQAMFGGQGPLTIYIRARDVEGNEAWVGQNFLAGSTTLSDEQPTPIVMDNDTIAKPFGTIDTPTQGQTVSGALWNWGWALTPDGNTAGGDAGDILIPTNGSTIRVWIDGASPGTVLYNMCRGAMAPFCIDDIASIFGNSTPQTIGTPRAGNPTTFRNLDANRGAIAGFFLNTAAYTNGVHTIAWSAFDNGVPPRGDGLGSRYFSVLNVGADGQAGTGDQGPGTGSVTLSRRNTTDPRSPVPDPRSPAEVLGRTGFSLDAPFAKLIPDAAGIHHVQIDDMGRLELQFTGLGRRARSACLAEACLGEGGPNAPNAGGLGPSTWLRAGEPALPYVVEQGYLVVNDEYRPLPVGSQFDVETGTFTWAPGVGFIGTYRLAFGAPRAEDSRSRAGVVPKFPRTTPALERESLAAGDRAVSDPRSRVPGPGKDLVLVDVTIRPVAPPAPGEATLRMSLDTPQPGATVSGSFLVAGWALDPRAAIGSGIGAVHVWAQRTDVPGEAPVFLGAAELGGVRPDVAGIYGAQFGNPGYNLSASALPPGTYDVTAFVWNTRTARWEDARTVSVNVR